MTAFKWPDSVVEKAAESLYVTDIKRSPDLNWSSWNEVKEENLLVGVQCIEDARAALDAALTEMLASGVAQEAIGSGGMLMQAHPIGSIMLGTGTYPVLIIRLPE